jgi:hypothetical protein
MSKDIVSEMVQQMGLTPQMVDRMQDQGQGYPQYQGMPGGAMQGGAMQGMHGMQGGAMPGGMGGLPSTPEEQMRLLQDAQSAAQAQGQAPPVDDYAGQNHQANQGDDESSQASTESDIDLEQIGLGHSRSTIDIIMEYLKDPIVVLVLYIILNLPEVDTLIRRTLPSNISGNVYYYLAIKGLILFSAYLLSRIILL